MSRFLSSHSGPRQSAGQDAPTGADTRAGIPAEICALIGAPALVLGVYVMRADVQSLFIAWGVALVLIGVVFSLLALGQVLNLCE